VDEITSPPDSPQTRTEPEAPARGGRDRTTRQAALLATLIALPITVAVAGFTFAKLSPDEPAAAPAPSPTAARPQSTAPVELAAPTLAERPATVCRALVSQLPPTVRDLAQRPVTAGPEQNAAYGDPALTVACGVTEPSVPATDDVWMINKVCWYAVEQSGATVLTTVDREAAVQVTVPRAYEQPLQWLSPISDAIVASIRSGGDVPAGCQA
jgi:hypothetical protein